MARILVVDDDEGVRSFLSDTLELAGHTVTRADSGEQALVHLFRNAAHLVLTDLKMPGMDGLALLAQVRSGHPDVEVIVLTAHGSIDAVVDAMKAGAFDFLQKPLRSPAQLRELVDRALERYRLRARQEVACDGPVARLSYGAPAMEAVVAALRKVAATDATVLLQGESGTGKEVAAQAVHRWSRRAEGPFVAVNCAVLSETLLDSELFGHEKGAFTGAVARRRGRIELAEGGTFFLDEVGELRPELQARLLRVLQERRFERVGGTQTVLADVRWIAASNRDLRAEVQAGRFREDLYFRLAVFPVRLPPLRERREDLPALARSLLEQKGRELGRPGLRLSAAALASLQAHPWPGNVRELANTLERAAILAPGEEIGPEERFLAPLGSAPTSLDQSALTMEEVERQAIRQALAAHEGNRRKAAEKLRIGLRTLYDKLKRYELG